MVQERRWNDRSSVIACKYLCHAGLSGTLTQHLANTNILQPVSKFATEEQKQAWLPPLVSGESRTCFGV
jgi:alkylation response protein AidB-like acyl-CoA dehydrogenase